MNKFLYNLQNEDEDTKIEGFRYIFLYMTFMFGFGFTVLPEFFGADQTVLYKVTQINLDSYVTNVWGVLAMVVSVATFLNIHFRNTRVGTWGTWTGAALWSYASIIYITDEFWFGLLVGAIPNLWFWTLLYWKIKRYHRKHD